MSTRDEATIRLGCFLGVLLAMGLWETVAPRRNRQIRRPHRWRSNLGLVAINTLVVRFLMPISALGTALIAETRSWGLLQQVAWPEWIETALAVIAFDLVIYLQHVAFHAVPLLWRLHRVHHADLDLDVTTGVRFHTLEVVLSLLIKVGSVIALGPSPLAVVIFEVLLNATSMFNHGNVRMPALLDRALRWIVVTPGMHQVHHSVEREETNSNYGFNLPWWDRLFGTYRDRPAAGDGGLRIGLEEERDERRVASLRGMLLMPFRGGRSARR